MSTDVLAELIDAKLALLRQLHELSSHQAQVIKQGEIGPIISVLAVKQRLLNAIEQVERRLDPFREEDPDRRAWASPVHRQRAREASERCDALLSEIMTVERDCEAQLSLRRDAAADQLRVAHFSTQATWAYQSTVGSSGGQFDASCES